MTWLLRSATSGRRHEQGPVSVALGLHRKKLVRARLRRQPVKGHQELVVTGEISSATCQLGRPVRFAAPAVDQDIEGADGTSILGNAVVLCKPCHIERLAKPHPPFCQLFARLGERRMLRSVLTEPRLGGCLDLDKYRIDRRAVPRDPHKVRNAPREIRKNRLRNNGGRIWRMPRLADKSKRAGQHARVTFEKGLKRCFGGGFVAEQRLPLRQDQRFVGIPGHPRRADA